MLISFNLPNSKLGHIIQLQDYLICYELNERELFFENDEVAVFCKSNAIIKNQLEVYFNTESYSLVTLKPLLKEDYFTVIINKFTSKITVIRDKSGINAGYYHANNGTLIISSLMHLISEFVPCQMDKNNVYQFLYSDYLIDGQTFYKELKGFEVGSEYTFNSNFEITHKTLSDFNLGSDENTLSEVENIKKLREEIVKAHVKYLNKENIVLLSGGIDSVAMMIALDDLLPKNQILAHSYKVKNITNADETVYAKSIADHLNIPIDIFETDLKGKISEVDFKTIVSKMNIPYCGVHFFMDNFKDNEEITYYAGQDTRLHTPSVNKIDLVAFNLFKKPKALLVTLNALASILRPMFRLFKNSSNRTLRGLLRATYVFDINQYVFKYYYAIDKKKLESYQLPTNHFEAYKSQYTLDLKNVKNKRGLYNAIVSMKWKEQYVTDIRYMQDMATMMNSNLAMPFYDIDLARYSATIPFDLSTKTMLGRSEFDEKNKVVYKYILRMALKDKIDKKTFNRSKAAPVTTFALFNDSMNDIIKSLFNEDLNSQNSFIRNFDLEQFINNFITRLAPWKEDDQGYLVKIYNTAALICYHQKIYHEA